MKNYNLRPALGLDIGSLRSVMGRGMGGGGSKNCLCNLDFC